MEFAKFCRVYLKLYPGNLAEYHSVKEFAYPRPKNVPAFKKHNPGTIIQGNHIGLLNKYEGVDGLKTGYIDESGYNLALTADKDGTRFIVVLLGVPADSGHRFGTINRDKDAANLLDWAYENYKTVRVKYPDFPRARVWKGRERKIDLVPADGDSLYGAFTVNKQRNASVGYKVEMVEGLTAPLEAGTVAANFILLDSEGELARAPLVLAKSVEKGNIFKRFWDSILMFFKGIKSV
jgi:D-alanyl-D-alanine carboxypeptidase (penicillin-binding protein 5/6)